MASVLICRDGREDSVVGNVALARAIAAAGKDVSIVFAGDALAALHTGTFEWSANFLTRDASASVIAAAERDGLPLADQARDRRWSDPRSLVAWAGRQRSIRVIACPIWTRLLAATNLPEHLETVTDGELVELLSSADTIIGGY